MSAAAVKGSENVRIESLKFKDDSQYRGQVRSSKAGSVPHGTGRMVTKEGFQMIGSFADGKAQGAGIFRAPNGDAFFGHWNKNHKRNGVGIGVSGKDGRQTVETYDDGKLTSKVKRGAVPSGTVHWSLGAAPFSGAVPAPRSGHSLIAFPESNLLVLFGGLVTDSEQKTRATNDVYLLDTATLKWSAPSMKGKPPPPLYGHTATLVGTDMVVIGGQNGMDVSSAVYVCDLTTGNWTCPIAKGLNLAYHSATLVGGTIWVIVQATVYTLRLSDWTWAEVETDQKGLGRLPRAFVSHSATAVGDKLFVFGGKILGVNLANPSAAAAGRAFQQCSADMRVFDTATLKWSVPQVSGPDGAQAPVEYAIGALPTWRCPRAEHTAVRVGAQIYVVGGWASFNPLVNLVDNSFLSDVQVFDTQTMRWATPSLYPLSAVRAMHAAALVGDQIWVFGGRNASSESLAEFVVLHTGSAFNETDLKPSAAASGATPKKPAGSAAAASAAAAAIGAGTAAAGTAPVASVAASTAAPKPTPTPTPAPAPAAAADPAPAAVPAPAAAAKPKGKKKKAAAGDDLLSQFAAQEGL